MNRNTLVQTPHPANGSTKKEMLIVPGAFAAMAFGDDKVAATIELVSKSYTGFKYVAKVVNQTDLALWCSVIGRSKKGDGVFFPESFWVEPNAAAAFPIETPSRFPWRIAKLVLDIRNQSLECSTETSVPLPPIVALIRAMSAATAMLVALVVGFVLLGERPRITQLSAPSTVVAGGLVPVGYRIEGAGRASYMVTAADGSVQTGPLQKDGQGFSFGTSGEPQTYRVAVQVSGPLGSQSDSIPVRSTSAHRSGNSSLIDYLEVSPPVVTSGKTITVRYHTRATSGRVALSDAFGATMQDGPLNPAGLSGFVAPIVASPTQFRVELDVVGNGSRSSTTTGMEVLPAGPAQLASPASVKPVPAPSDYPVATLVHVSPAYISSTQNFTVTPLRRLTNARLTLQDYQGAPIAAQTLQGGQSKAIFQAPFSDRDQSMTLVIAYQIGGSTHVVLQPLVVHAQ